MDTAAITMHTELDDLPSDVQTPILSLGWLAWSGTAVISFWSTLVAFSGGTLPLTSLELQGGLGTGLCWFFFVAPTLMVVGHCISVMLISGLAMLTGQFCVRRSHRS